MKMKKILSLCITCALSMSILSGCNKSNINNNIVNISILNSKPEISSSLEDIIEKFEKENNDTRIKVIKYSQSGSYRDKIGAMNSVNNAPTLTLVDASDVKRYSDICLNLSDEKWISDISGEISSIAKNKNNEVIAFPFTTEGAGFIYNKKVTDEAGINVNEINTISELEEAFQKINSIGKDSLIITNEEWSLGDHFLATFYAIDIKKSGLDNEKYFESLKNNADSLVENKTLNGLIDTFDIMKKYNIYKDSPLSPSYDKCFEVLGSGKVGFWYMGNWAAQSILAESNGNNNFGFIPVPISNESSDYGNNEIAVGITKYFILNKNSSETQIEAAKKFLNYLVYEEEGQKFITEDCGIIPAFSNIEVEKSNSFTNEILKYRDQNKTVELMNSYLPPNNSAVIGLALKKYLNDEITREALMEEVKFFWKNS